MADDGKVAGVDALNNFLKNYKDPKTDWQPPRLPPVHDFRDSSPQMFQHIKDEVKLERDACNEHPAECTALKAALKANGFSPDAYAYGWKPPQP